MVKSYNTIINKMFFLTCENEDLPVEGQRKGWGEYHRRALRGQAGAPRADTGWCKKICGIVAHFSAPGRSTDTSSWLAWLTLLTVAYQVLTWMLTSLKRTPQLQICRDPSLTHDTQVKLVFFFFSVASWMLLLSQLHCSSLHLLSSVPLFISSLR